MELVGQTWFWPAVTALVTLAALVGSGFSWAVATYLRWRTRPEPDWLFELQGTAMGPDSERGGGYFGYTVSGTVTNVGDGVAHSVRILSVNSCTAGIFSRPRTRGTVPIMDRGDTEDIRVRVPPGSWESAAFELEWIDPPTRLKRKRRIGVDFRSMVERPKAVDWDSQTGEQVESSIE